MHAPVYAALQKLALVMAVVLILLALGLLIAGAALMDWLASILTSGQTRKAQGLLLAALTIALFLLNLCRAGARAGRLAERLSTSEKTHEFQRQMLDASSRRPADRDALAGWLRDRRF